MSAYRRLLIETGRLVPRAPRRPALYDARPYLPQDDWGYHAAARDIAADGIPLHRLPIELATIVEVYRG